MKKMDPRAHWEPIRMNNGADTYCMKEDTRVEGPWEFGIKPARRNAKGETAARNRAILEYGPEQAVTDGLIKIDHYKKIKDSVDLFRIVTSEATDATDVRGHWYWGPPGTGKSRKAR